MADADDLFALDADPEVMRYLTGGEPTPYEHIRDRLLPALLREYDGWTGLGRFAAIERSSGRFVGWFGLRPCQRFEGAEAELGYRLRREVWGRGYATEGARALVRRAFAELGLPSVFAWTMAVNVASRRVLEKAGLRQTRAFHLAWRNPIPGTEHGEVEYALARPAWERIQLTSR
jgi:RimJ/RimL family protein N-acetyltransferase